jgi:hypothetical protein
MTIGVARHFLLWCTVINYGLLLFWFAIFAFAHDRFEHILGRWFRLSRDQFDAYNGVGMTIYKLGIVLFNLVPFVALMIVT